METGRFIPTPYPLHDRAGIFRATFGERNGIFIGTREWNVPSRQPPRRALSSPLDWANRSRLLTEIRALSQSPGSAWPPGQARPHDRTSACLIAIIWRRWRSTRSSFRPTIARSRAGCGGRLLCRIPCVGGNGAIDRLGFPQTCGHGRSLEELQEIASRLLGDDGFYKEIVEESQQLARERASFEIVAKQLTEFYAERFQIEIFQSSRLRALLEFGSDRVRARVRDAGERFRSTRPIRVKRRRVRA